MPAALHSDRRLLRRCASVALVTALACSRSSTRGAPDIPVEELKPPAQYVTGLQQFIGTADNASTQFGKGQAGTAPRHGDAVWGYYTSSIDQEPWKSQLLAQETAARQPTNWPPVPLSGPILEAPGFQDRPLELYVSVKVLPTQDWAAYALSGLQQSAADTGDPGKQARTANTASNSLPKQADWRRRRKTSASGGGGTARSCSRSPRWARRVGRWPRWRRSYSITRPRRPCCMASTRTRLRPGHRLHLTSRHRAQRPWRRRSLATWRLAPRRWRRASSRATAGIHMRCVHLETKRQLCYP